MKNLDAALSHTDYCVQTQEILVFMLALLRQPVGLNLQKQMEEESSMLCWEAVRAAPRILIAFQGGW